MKMPRLALRRPAPVVTIAMPEDFARIAELHSMGFQRGWSTEEIEQLALDTRVSILVARHEGGGREAARGFVIFRLAAGEAEILSIAVEPRWRGDGFGWALMQATLLALRHDRAKRLVLEVEDANVAATALYRRLGLKEVGRRKGYYTSPGKPATDALVMAMDLL